MSSQLNSNSSSPNILTETNTGDSYSWHTTVSDMSLTNTSTGNGIQGDTDIALDYPLYRQIKNINYTGNGYSVFYDGHPENYSTNGTQIVQNIFIENVVMFGGKGNIYIRGAYVPEIKKCAAESNYTLDARYAYYIEGTWADTAAGQSLIMENNIAEGTVNASSTTGVVGYHIQDFIHGILNNNYYEITDANASTHLASSAECWRCVDFTIDGLQTAKTYPLRTRGAQNFTIKNFGGRSSEVYGNTYIPVAPLGEVLYLTINNGGSGYSINDVLTITTGNSDATFLVTSVSSGAVASLRLLTRGTGYARRTLQATSGGHGSACTVNISQIDENANIELDNYWSVFAPYQKTFGEEPRVINGSPTFTGNYYNNDFPSYILPNTIDTNLLTNSNFDEAGAAWTIDSGASSVTTTSGGLGNKNYGHLVATGATIKLHQLISVSSDMVGKPLTLSFLARCSRTNATAHINPFITDQNGYGDTQTWFQKVNGTWQIITYTWIPLIAGNSGSVGAIIDGLTAGDTVDLAYMTMVQGQDSRLIYSSQFVKNDIYPATNNTYYLGKNDDDSPFAWKGIILKDTTNGKYYRVEVISGVVTATDLTD